MKRSSLLPLNWNYLNIVIVVWLVFFCYGQFWNRGGYADDFAFLAYVTPHSYWDAVTQWSDTFNSRIAQAVLMPLLMKGLAGGSPETFNWSMFHLVGIIAFCLTLYFLDRILQLFAITWPVRLVIGLLFALNPIKNEALLWPATIVGYIIPICFFFLACWVYLATRNDHNKLNIIRILPFALVLFSIFAIEQLVPIFVALIGLRLVFLSITKKGLVIDLLFTLAALLSFVAITFLGKTTERLVPFLSFDVSSIANRFISVTLASFKDIFGYSFSVLLDSFFWEELWAAALTPEYLVSILTLGFLLRLLLSTPTVSLIKLEPGQFWGLCFAGVALWLASLSPFIILSYYLPPRALYLPSLGLALIGGAMLAFVLPRIHSLWVRTTIISGVVAVFAVFILINIYTQRDFTRTWRNEQKIIRYVSSSIDEKIPDGTDVSIFNIPVDFGPSPGFVNNFSMNGIVNWFVPGKFLSGSTRNDISDVIDWPNDLITIGNSNVPMKRGYWFLLWTSEGIVQVKNLRTSTKESAMDCSNLKSVISEGKGPIDLEVAVNPLAMHAVYEKGIVLRVGGTLYNRCLDIGIVEVFIDSPDGVKQNLKLYLHAVNLDGAKIPYDLSATQINGFRNTKGGNRKYIFINNYSSVSALELSVGGLAKMETIVEPIRQQNRPDTGYESQYSPQINFF